MYIYIYNVLVHSYDIMLDVLLINQTQVRRYIYTYKHI